MFFVIIHRGVLVAYNSIATGELGCPTKKISNWSYMDGPRATICHITLFAHPVAPPCGLYARRLFARERKRECEIWVGDHIFVARIVLSSKLEGFSKFHLESAGEARA